MSIGRPVIDIPKEMLELCLEHHFTRVQIAQLFSMSTKTFSVVIICREVQKCFREIVQALV